MSAKKQDQQPEWQETLQQWQDFSVQWGMMSQQLWLSSVEKCVSHDWFKQPYDPYNLKEAWSSYFIGSTQHPEKFMKAQKVLLDKYTDYLHDHVNKNENFFDLMKGNYALFSEWITESLEEQTQSLDENSKKKLSFFTKQFLDAFNPNNFAFSNPEVVEETIKTNGQNLIEGFQNLIKDMQRSDDILPKITMANEAAFKLGENIASTKGSVIYRNDMMELIQYQPQTDTVFKTPLLIIPPWINKYYILDLNEEKSFVRWAVAQGHQVFIISWKNPTPETHKNISFDHYAFDGVLKALDVVKDVTTSPQAHMLGYCIGGTLLAMVLSYLQKNKRDQECVSATFLTTLLDFQNAGDLKLFIDEQQIAHIERMMDDQGILEADILKATFNMLRANDLIWSFVINNYLLGKPPLPFDLLYWNNDSTNLPAKMHSYYLRNMYLHNRLIEKDTLSLGDTKIDLSSVETPCFFLSTKDDHIAPWLATYSGARLMNNHPDTEFVLAGSGHIAGVVNPPSRHKYGFRTNKKLCDDPIDWIEKTAQHDGSWWGYWQNWISAKAGDQMKVPTKLGNKRYKPLCDAPGTYVLEKSE